MDGIKQMMQWDIISMSTSVVGDCFFLFRALINASQAGWGGLLAIPAPDDQDEQGQYVGDGIQKEGRDLNAARLE